LNRSRESHRERNMAYAALWLSLFLSAGLLFGWLGWNIIKLPNGEVIGLILFYFPALAISSLFHITATDHISVLLTTAFYGTVGFLLGWGIEKIIKRIRRI